MHKILVIDDEPDILDTVADLIEAKFSCGVDKAKNGLDGFMMCTKEKYDLIITDQKMPFMTGAAFIIANKTREESLNSDTTIIMLSGFIDEELKKKLGVQGVRYIAKPFQPDDLFNLVRDYLL